MGGKLWVISGFATMLCIFVPTNIMVLAFILILFLSIIIPTIYSYVIHKNKMKSGD